MRCVSCEAGMALLWHELLKLTGISRAAEPQWAGNWRVVRVITCTRYGEYRFRGISGTACMYDIGRGPGMVRPDNPLCFLMTKTLRKSGAVFQQLPSPKKACRHALPESGISTLVRMVSLWLRNLPGNAASRRSQDNIRESGPVREAEAKKGERQLSVSESEGIIRELAEEHPTLFMT